MGTCKYTLLIILKMNIFAHEHLSVHTVSAAKSRFQSVSPEASVSQLLGTTYRRQQHSLCSSRSDISVSLSDFGSVWRLACKLVTFSGRLRQPLSGSCSMNVSCKNLNFYKTFYRIVQNKHLWLIKEIKDVSVDAEEKWKSISQILTGIDIYRNKRIRDWRLSY